MAIKYTVFYDNHSIYPFVTAAPTPYWGNSLQDAMDNFNKDHVNCSINEKVTWEYNMGLLLGAEDG